jgi:hypothetical protein
MEGGRVTVNWWDNYSDRAAQLYRIPASEKDVSRAREALSNLGCLYTLTEGEFAGGLHLLTHHLRQLETPPRDVLRDRILTYANRPRPYLPELSPLGQARDFTEHSFSPHRTFAWVDPRRILLKEPGTKSFIHYDIDGLVDFACRIAEQRGNPDMLHSLLGNPGDGAAHVHIEGWSVFSDQIFRIQINGNHRLTVFAALGVPCILAEIQDNMGPFKPEPLPINPHAEMIGLYRRLLHTYGVASFDELGLVSSEAHTDWPILLSCPRDAVESLAAVEGMTGRGRYLRVGELPRRWFDDPEFLEAASADLYTHLVAYRQRWTNLRESQRDWFGRHLFNRKMRMIAKQSGPTHYGKLPRP